MNKPSIKYIRLNQEDVISTSGQVYFTMSGIKNGINGDMTLISSDGSQTFGVDDFGAGRALAGKRFVYNSSNIASGFGLSVNEESNDPDYSRFNGNYEYVYSAAQDEYVFLKIN